MQTFLIVMTTAVVTFILTLGGLALYVAKSNPYNVQACIISGFLGGSGGAASGASGSPSVSGGGADYDHPLLNDSQEQMLQGAGIDPATLPTEISPEMEACFKEKLGAQRVLEIMQGATPGPLDLLKAKSCL